MKDTEKTEKKEKKPKTPTIDSRFEIKQFNDGLWGGYEACEIIVDKETGVNYLYRQVGTTVGMAGGLTVLVDAQGKPVVTNV